VAGGVGVAKVSGCVEGMKMLAWIALHYPQMRYTGLVMLLQSKWLDLPRAIPGVED